MKMFRRILGAALLAGATLLPAAASAQPPIPPIPGCERRQLLSGAFSLICVPPPGSWNGELVVFAHGYVPFNFTASPVARAALGQYETNGNLSIPLVTLHTTGDEVIPFWHELLYLPKVDLFGRGRFFPIPARRYGHCNFTANEVLTAFALAVRQP